MKHINIYPILSSLHDDKYIEEARKNLLNSLSTITGYSFEIVEIDDLYKADLGIIIVESGGSENYFLQVYDKLKEPFIFLTFKHNNSLAASLEILSFLKRNKKEGEILHGDATTIAKRLKEIVEGKNE